MASKVAKGMKQVRPVLSQDQAAARKRVLQLYKACYRYVPYMLHIYDVPLTQQEAQEKLRSLFRANANVKDIRVIDSLILKGQKELNEVRFHWMHETHAMRYYKDTVPKKPTDFLGKFFQGVE